MFFPVLDSVATSSVSTISESHYLISVSPVINSVATQVFPIKLTCYMLVFMRTHGYGQLSSASTCRATFRISASFVGHLSPMRWRRPVVAERCSPHSLPRWRASCFVATRCLVIVVESVCLSSGDQTTAMIPTAWTYLLGHLEAPIAVRLVCGSRK